MKNKIIKINLIIILFIICYILTGCTLFKKKLFSKTYFEYFDTVITIQGYEKKESDFLENTKQVDSFLEEYHKLYDIYYEYSGINNICTINKNAGQKAVKVDEKIINLIEYGIKMYDETSGMLNIAMGSVLKLWHNEREKAIDGIGKLPDKEKLIEASKHTNVDDIVINKEESTIYLKDKDMSIDVGSIAKGYVTDKLTQHLKDKRVTSYILNLGGNIGLVGEKGDNTPWKVGIQNPDLTSENTTIRVFNLKDTSVVTSGSYQRYYEVDGTKYHHIINPITLMPENNYLSVSIITNSSVLADCLSTALFNLSIEDGKKILAKYENTYAMWIDKDNNVHYSNGLEAFL